MNETPKILYIASSRLGRPALARVRVIKETPKHYVIDRANVEHLLAWQFVGERVSKDAQGLFESPAQALNYMIGKLTTRVELLNKEIETLTTDIKTLAQVRDMLSHE